ncbi:MAG: hypothetical protein V3T72_13110, partial [Thermoanaerobaculia bacterium]
AIGLSVVLLSAATQQRQVAQFAQLIGCARILIYPNEGNLMVALVVPCPADLTLCDRTPLPLADGTVVRGCPGPFTATTRTLPNAVCGDPYIGWFAAVDGNPPYTWMLTPFNADGSSSVLPTGLTLNFDGSVTGTVPFLAPECQTGSGLVAVNPTGTVYGGGG